MRFHYAVYGSFFLPKTEKDRTLCIGSMLSPLWLLIGSIIVSVYLFMEIYNKVVKIDSRAF